MTKRPYLAISNRLRREWKVYLSRRFWILAALLFLLCTLAVLQHRWIDQLAEAQRQGAKASLSAALSNVESDFDIEITRAFVAFQVPLADLIMLMTRRLTRRRTGYSGYNRRKKSALYEFLCRTLKTKAWLNILLRIGGTSTGNLYRSIVNNIPTKRRSQQVSPVGCFGRALPGRQGQLLHRRPDRRVRVGEGSSCFRSVDQCVGIPEPSQEIA